MCVSIPSDNPILLARDFGPDTVSLAVGEGEIVVLPGAYDEAFLRALSGADPNWRGGLWLKGEALHRLRPAARLRFATANCSVAPRTGRLLPELNVVENTALPLLLAGLGRPEAGRRARRWLDRLDVSACADWRIGELTRAEMRRVALARALVLDPAILFVEDLSEGMSAPERFHLLRILRAACGTHTLTMVVTSDDADVARWADRRVQLRTSSLAAEQATTIVPAFPEIAADGQVEPAAVGIAVAAATPTTVSTTSSTAVSTAAAPAEPAEPATPEPVLLLSRPGCGLPHRISRHARGEHRHTAVGSGAERGR